MATPDFNKVIAQMQAAQDAANKANLQRYNQLLSQLGKLGQQTQATYGEALKNLEGVGKAGRTRIEQGKTRAVAASEQDLISRGLGNTTIRQSVRRGIADDAELQRQSLEESIAQQLSGVLQGRVGAELDVGRMLAGAIEGRNDVGPDASLWANLIRSAAAANTQPVQTSVGRGLPPTAPGGGFRAGFGGGGGGGGGAGGLSIGGGSGGAAGSASVVGAVGGGYDPRAAPGIPGAGGPVTGGSPGTVPDARAMAITKARNAAGDSWFLMSSEGKNRLINKYL